MTSTRTRPIRQLGWRPDRLADSIVLLLALTFAQRVIGFLRGVLFCRWLEPAELGQWDMALGFIELAAPVMVLGLPGSFGRYVEHYREQQQLRTFLRRTTFAAAALAIISISLIASCSEWFSSVVFGTRDQTFVVLLMSAGLVAVVAYNFLNTLLTAMRRSRVVSGLEFINGALFATLAIGLLLGWRTDAASIVAAHSLACLATAFLAFVWIRPIWQSLPEFESQLSHRALWSKLLPFAIWVWGTNWLANLFELADRYMIIHYGGFGATEALVEVGNYHSSRVLPMLLVSITALLGTMVTPYLSHDWETAGREAVSARMNFTLKLLGICLLICATLILVAAPLLFEVAFKGKFTGGLAVLPLTLTYCLWFGLARVAQKYLWCAERVGFAAFSWLLGLIVNIGLILLLLPRFGLAGVVMSTAAGNLVALVAMYAINSAYGMRIELATLVLSTTPALLVCGGWMAVAVSSVVLVAAACTDWLLNSAEKQQLSAVWCDYRDRLGCWILGRNGPVLKEAS